MDIQTSDGSDSNGKNIVSLSMKPSHLLETVDVGRKIFYCKTFVNEWYLSFKQHQVMYIDMVCSGDGDDEDTIVIMMMMLI